MPLLGGPAIVASDGAGGIVVAVTDETEDDADVAVSRHDAEGALLWSLRYEGGAGLDDAALDVAVASDGSIYIVVSEQTLELVSEGFGNRAEFNVVVLAIDPDGTRRWRWERVVPPPMYNNNTRVAALGLSAGGRVVVVDANGTEDAVAPPSFVELDRWGNEITRAELDATLDGVFRFDLAIAPSEDVVAVAWMSAENWVARLRRDATIVWEARSGSGSGRSTAVAAGDDDAAYVLFATGDDEAGDGGFELRRYDPDGAVAWTYGSQWPTPSGYPTAVVVDCDGTALVACEHEDSPQRSAWIGAITTEGALAWSSTLGDDRPIAPRSFARGHDGTLVVGGLQGSELAPWVARLRRP